MGYRDTDPYRLKMNGLGEDADGHVYPASHTWDADFTQTKLGWTITLHLEGSYVNL